MTEAGTRLTESALLTDITTEQKILALYETWITRYPKNIQTTKVRNYYQTTLRNLP